MECCQGWPSGTPGLGAPMSQRPQNRGGVVAQQWSAKLAPTQLGPSAAAVGGGGAAGAPHRQAQSAGAPSTRPGHRPAVRGPPRLQGAALLELRASGNSAHLTNEIHFTCLKCCTSPEGQVKY